MTDLQEATETGFRNEIETLRNCWDTMRIYADFLDDQDRESESLVWRWLAKYQRIPHKRGYYTQPSRFDGELVRTITVPQKFKWAWYPEGLTAHKIDPHPTREARLDRLVFLSLRRGGHDHAYFPSYWEAVEALAAGLLRLRRIVDVN